MGRSENGTVRMSGRYVLRDVGAATTGSIPLNPIQLDSRLLTISDAWLEFRFTRVKVYAFPSTNNTALGQAVALAYDPNILAASPSSYADMSTLQQYAIGNGNPGAPFPNIYMSKAALLGPAPVRWYRRGTTQDDTLETQGQIWYYTENNFSSIPLFVVVQYEIEFRGPAATALTEQLTTDPVELARQVQELQMALGMEHSYRKRVARPPPVEVKTDEDYLTAEEPHLAESPVVVAEAPKAVKPAVVPATPKPRPPR